MTLATRALQPHPAERSPRGDAMPARVETTIRHSRNPGRRAVPCTGHWIIEPAGASLRARCSRCGERREYLGRSLSDAEFQLAAETEA